MTVSPMKHGSRDSRDRRRNDNPAVRLLRPAKGVFEGGPTCRPMFVPCWKIRLTSVRRTRLRTIARVHSEETGAPKFFCQIVIDEKKPTSRYLGPSRSSGQIWVRGDIRGGRTVEQRTKLMLRMMEEISRITGVKQEEIWVYVCNLVPTDMVEYGHVLPKPGEEKAWFDGLPKPLQDHMKRLGATRETFTL
jgi:hypothetical protein